MFCYTKEGLQTFFCVAESHTCDLIFDILVSWIATPRIFYRNRVKFGELLAKIPAWPS